MNMSLPVRALLPLCVALTGLTLMATEAMAGPIELSVQPSAGNVYTGDRLSVEIAISGLDGADLGGFDLSLAFDPAVIQYQSYSLGTALIDPGLGQQDLTDDSGAATGLLKLAEVSYLLDFSGQPEAFVLATVSFIARQPGSSELSLSFVDLSDDFGDPLTVYTSNNASVTVPLPGTLLLVPAGLGLLHLRRRRPFSR